MGSPRIAPLASAAAYQGYTTLLYDHLTVQLFQDVSSAMTPGMRIAREVCLAHRSFRELTAGVRVFVQASASRMQAPSRPALHQAWL